MSQSVVMCGAGLAVSTQGQVWVEDSGGQEREVDSEQDDVWGRAGGGVPRASVGRGQEGEVVSGRSEATQGCLWAGSWQTGKRWSRVLT